MIPAQSQFFKYCLDVPVARLIGNVVADSSKDQCVRILLFVDINAIELMPPRNVGAFSTCEIPYQTRQCLGIRTL